MAGRAGGLLRFGHDVAAAAPRLSLAALAAMVCGVALELAALALLAPLLALARGGASGAFPAGWPDALAGRLGFDTLLCGYVALLGLLGAVTQWCGLAYRRIAYAYSGRLRRQLLAGLLRARWDFAGGLKTAELNHVFTTAPVYLVIGAQQLWQLLAGSLAICVYAGMCLAWSPRITALTALSLSLPLLLGAARRRSGALVRRRLAEASLRYDATVADALASVRWAKTHGATGRVFGAMERTLDAYAAADIALLRHSSASRLMQTLWAALMMGAALYLALIRLHLPLTQIVVLLFVLYRVWPRVAGLIAMVHQIDHALPFRDETLRLARAVDAAAEPEVESGRGAIGALPLRDAIELRSVSFRHAGAGPRPVLNRYSATIRAGTITALVGPSGVGKSTLLDLVAGLLQPSSGEVLVDGRGLGPALLPAWRRSIACVGTDSPLFHASLRKNLLLGAPSATDEELWAALEFAAAAGFVRGMPGGLDAMVGESGTRMSTGERQRVCLARAVLQRPRLLVLDEATNALDEDTEARIFRRLRGLRDECTVLMVSHRPSVRGLADQVLELGGGTAPGRTADAAHDFLPGGNARRAKPENKAMIEMNTMLARSTELVTTGLDSGELALLSILNGKYFSANAMGRRVWDWLESPRTVEQLRQSILDEYLVPPERCAADLCGFLRGMVEAGLVDVLA